MRNKIATVLLIRLSPFLILINALLWAVDARSMCVLTVSRRWQVSADEAAAIRGVSFLRSIAGLRGGENQMGWSPQGTLGNIMDTLINTGQIQPIVVVFIFPKTLHSMNT
jgi:hypothetical protein